MLNNTTTKLMEQNKNITAVEWLVEQLLDGKLLMPSLIEQAKEMEKVQIRLAILDGYAQGEIQCESDIDDHYNKRYGK